MTDFDVLLKDADATAAAGALLARHLSERAPAGAVIHLDGDLGAGKTTLARGLLQALGVQGTIRSPTYTLMEPYAPARWPGWQILHMDLYRLHSPEELWELGLDSYAPDSAVWLVEWPARGGGVLPAADLSLRLERSGEQRRLTGHARAPWAAAWAAALNNLD